MLSYYAQGKFVCHLTILNVLVTKSMNIILVTLTTELGSVLENRLSSL